MKQITHFIGYKNEWSPTTGTVFPKLPVYPVWDPWYRDWFLQEYQSVSQSCHFRSDIPTITVTDVCISCLAEKNNFLAKRSTFTAILCIYIPSSTFYKLLELLSVVKFFSAFTCWLLKQKCLPQFTQSTVAHLPKPNMMHSQLGHIPLPTIYWRNSPWWNLHTVKTQTTACLP